MAIPHKFPFIFFASFRIKSFISAIKIVIFVLGISLIAQSQSKAAQSVPLDFGNQGTVGRVTPPTNSIFISNANTQNSLTEFIIGNLVTVDLAQISGNAALINFFNDVPRVGLSGFVTHAPFNSVEIINEDSYNIILTKLNESLTYNINYTVGGFTSNNFTDLELVSDGQSTSVVDSNNSSTVSADPITDLTTDVFGNLIIQTAQPQTSKPTEAVVVSGLFLQSIPEPSSIFLVALAVLAAIFLRRRRSLK